MYCRPQSLTRPFGPRKDCRTGAEAVKLLGCAIKERSDGSSRRKRGTLNVGGPRYVSLVGSWLGA